MTMALHSMRCVRVPGSARRNIIGTRRRAKRWRCIVRFSVMCAQLPDPAPRVAVVLLHWNGTDDTVECLSSLRLSDYPRCEVVVVDNGSRPSPRPRIVAEFPSVTYLETPINLGYAGGNNVGMRYALVRGHDYVFVLNNDTIVERDMLRRAVSAA